MALRAVELGAGELAVTSIDREGTGKGYDVELTREIAGLVPVPVIAGGGAGSVEHVRDVVVEGRADAVSMASLLHYNFIRTTDFSRGDFSLEGNLEFARGARGVVQFSKVKDCSLADLKKALAVSGVQCRENACSSG